MADSPRLRRCHRSRIVKIEFERRRRLHSRAARRARYGEIQV
ncbi:Uncharacterised protein [Amycolatopsis camponoti]|uniref:Uncharacterized protein n=1 Tax=Amycolatopsis camponoti TaxID=2606593 RepID=A0A6I8LDR9_9PSEU|nr:Uncharacterised protein [Amycolatopsis camponoti]